MAAERLVPPADLPAVGFAVGLGVALGGFDGGAGVDEEEGGHGEGGEGGDDGLGVGRWVSACAQAGAGV